MGGAQGGARGGSAPPPFLYRGTGIQLVLCHMVVYRGRALPTEKYAPPPLLVPEMIVVGGKIGT